MKMGCGTPVLHTLEVIRQVTSSALISLILMTVEAQTQGGSCRSLGETWRCGVHLVIGTASVH